MHIYNEMVWINMFKTKNLFLLFLLLIIIVGCSTNDPTSNVVDGIGTPVLENINRTPIPTFTPVPTILITSLPPTDTTVPPTIKPTEYSQSEPTLIPTLSSDEKAQNLIELMQTNNGCDLPCWWGIVPGESSLQETMNDLTQKGFRAGTTSTGLRVHDDFGVFLQFELDEDIIQAIHVRGDYLTGAEETPAFSQAFAYGWQDYSIKEIFNRFGVPSKVLIYSPFRADPGQDASYHLLIFYEDLGIEVEYRGTAEQLNGNQYRACPNLNDIWEIGLFLYQPDQGDGVVQKLLPPESISYIAKPDEVYSLISWQQATNTSLESLHQTFGNSDEVCFEFLTH